MLPPSQRPVMKMVNGQLLPWTEKFNIFPHSMWKRHPLSLIPVNSSAVEINVCEGGTLNVQSARLGNQGHPLSSLELNFI